MSAAVLQTLSGRHGAFVSDGSDEACALRLRQVHGEAGPLAGLRLAVKDVFEVEGLRVGAGQPDWFAEQAEAKSSAPAVRVLLDAGAQWVGKTVTDELTYSLAGNNAHYGKPTNPAVPDRLSGGSSSGSVVAVAAGHADIALGTDCGGSTRLPASYCGVWGMRPTHGRIAAQGCFTLAHSFDTVGWFATNADAMARVFEQLARSRVVEARAIGPLVVAADVMPLLDAPVRTAYEALIAQLRELAPVTMLPEGTLPLADWANAFRVLQASEIWLQLGDWVRSRQPHMGEDVTQRFDAAARVRFDEVAQMQRLRVDANATMARVLAGGAVIVWPTVPTPAPSLDASFDAVNDIRARAFRMLAPAGLAGLPQLSMPWMRSEGAPVGLSVIGARGDDEGVLQRARLLSERLGLASAAH
ncbi:amidase [Pseudacidovorax intermedius]|uniref:Amidase n=1 Tax=Pseudacidovorax intermedius TaxID=433924 RepID=A0A370F5P1_9BURK|nr:amidase [Pseudacidovorax intermedius]RDI19077.1 amidase [Pseudacidovorax intermedius]